uniref:Uncharacterized protein MANES_11G061900 n=1 Tax=Rhizophora mucronata TaxID=61149 RepID=A0A2P2PMF5_RHIMU
MNPSHFLVLNLSWSLAESHSSFAGMNESQIMMIENYAAHLTYCSVAWLAQNLASSLSATQGSVDSHVTALEEFGIVIAAWPAYEAGKVVLAVVKE